jgi:hypothetical protein
MITFLGAAWWPPILQTAIGGLLAIAGGVQDFLTLNKGESIFNPVEFRERLANDIDEIKPRASALISSFVDLWRF